MTLYGPHQVTVSRMLLQITALTLEVGAALIAAIMTSQHSWWHVMCVSSDVVWNAALCQKAGCVDNVRISLNTVSRSQEDDSDVCLAGGAVAVLVTWWAGAAHGYP